MELILEYFVKITKDIGGRGKMAKNRRGLGSAFNRFDEKTQVELLGMLAKLMVKYNEAMRYYDLQAEGLELDLDVESPIEKQKNAIMHKTGWDEPQLDRTFVKFLNLYEKNIGTKSKPKSRKIARNAKERTADKWNQLQPYFRHARALRRKWRDESITRPSPF